MIRVSRLILLKRDVRLSDVAVEGGINSWLAMHYFGRLGGREYEKMTAAENAKHGLMMITLTPTSVRGFDNHRMIGAPLRAFMRIRNALPIPRSWI